jgi:hypothetical protein
MSSSASYSTTSHLGHDVRNKVTNQGKKKKRDGLILERTEKPQADATLMIGLTVAGLSSKEDLV